MFRAGVVHPKSQKVMSVILQHPREGSADIAAVRPVTKPRIRRLRKVPWAAQPVAGQGSDAGLDLKVQRSPPHMGLLFSVLWGLFPKWAT